VARHAYPPLDNLSPRLVEEMRKRVAPDRGNVWKMLMWSPGMAEALIDFNDAVRYKTSLSDSLRELIILRVGHLCEADYEIHHHNRIAREIGISEELIAAPKVGASAPGLDTTQRLALSLTDDLVKDRAGYGLRTAGWTARSRRRVVTVDEPRQRGDHAVPRPELRTAGDRTGRARAFEAAGGAD